MPACYAIKADVAHIDAGRLAFRDQKTMYGGKRIEAGDTIFLFASENARGAGLFACGTVVAVAQTPRRPGVQRQTPRVSIAVEVTSRARRPLGRTELKPFTAWDDGLAQSELNFKFYRQATDKIVGLSPGAAAFLRGFF